MDIFESLFDAHYNELYCHALSFVRDKEQARDIVMDTYEYLWNNFHKIDLSGSLRPLLYTLTGNRCIDFLRHEKSKRRYLEHRETVLQEAGVYRDYGEVIQKVMAAIDELPPQMALVFKECFIEGKKYKEVGEELNISVNTVKWHITRALAELRKRLSGLELLLFIAFLYPDRFPRN